MPPRPLPVIPGTYRLALNWQAAGGQTAANVMHFSAETLTASEVIDSFISGSGTGLWGSVATAAVVTDIACTPLDGHSATVHRIPGDEATFTGQSGGPWVPAAAVVVKLTTADRGRSNRGRVFLPFTTEGVMTDGQVDSGTVTAMQTAWDGAHSAWTALNLILVVASYKLASEHTVIATFVEPTLATQRRRQGRLR